MRINSNYNSLNIDSNKTVNKNRVSNTFNKITNTDVFVKSTPAFKGSFEEDLIQMTMNRIYDMVQEVTNPVADDEDDIIRLNRREFEVALYIETNSNKQVQKNMLAVKNEKLKTINANVFDCLGVDLEYINQLFEQANIRTILALNNFIMTYNRDPDTREVFSGQEIEAVKIYGILDIKDDLSKFSELLLYLYNQEEESNNPDYGKLNETTSFLKKVGVTKFKEFDEKFSCLKSRFNDFQTISDKVDAIEYLQKTYDKKISLLTDLVSNIDLPKNLKIENLYSSVNDIVEYFYEKNSGESLNGLEDIIDYIVSQGKLKTTSLKQVLGKYNDFKTPEDKIDFFRFLKDCSITIAEFNSLSRKSLISDIDKMSVFANKQILSQYIAQIKDIKESDVFGYYKNFSDMLNALYDKTENPEKVKKFIDLSDRFNLNNSDSFLQFYNRASGTKKCNITSQELKDFIELFNYSDSTSLFSEAKAKNILVIDLLNREKQQFLSVKDDIDNFVYSGNTTFFSGKSSLEIYKNYRTLILENSDRIPSILQNIVDFDIQNAKQYSQKALQVKPFTNFFEDKESMLKFFTDNDIKFDDSQEDSLYRQNCLEIFEALYDENDKQKSLERINYIATSGFLVKSQSRLSELLEKMPSSDMRNKVLSIIADKKIPSINSLEKFFRQYNLSDTKGVELLEYLSNLPENIDFAKCIEILESVQENIDSLNIPIRINSRNINSININDFIDKKTVSISSLIGLLDDISGASETTNFIATLPASISGKKSNVFSSYRIAQEIASKIDISDESYQNISRLLGIDKVSLQLPSNCSYYFYVQAIEKSLPEEFIDFVNSDEWMKYSDDSAKSASLVLHARLRAIDRFALNGAENINVLYTKETLSKLQNLFRTVYTESPIDIKGTDSLKRFVADFIHDSNVIEAVFLDNGEMITIVQKKKARSA